MSGRTRHWRDGELITNRKTDRRQTERVPSHALPEYCLRVVLPPGLAFAVAPGPTGTIGVQVGFGPVIEAKGRDRDWVIAQACRYLGSIAGAMPFNLPATLTRDAYPGPTPDSPLRPNVKVTLELVYVPERAVVIPRAHDPAMVVALP